MIDLDAIRDQLLSQPEMQVALAEMRAFILERFPEATFRTFVGDEPLGVYLATTVDVDDPDELLDVVIDRVLDLQIEHGIPLHVLPLRTPERNAKMLAEQANTALGPPTA